MTQTTFRALLVEKTEDGAVTRQVTQLPLENLPSGEVLVQVHYSSLNYKDALSATGHPGVTKQFPHVPGIDAAGTVISSTVAEFQPQDPVLVTGFDLGMNTWGGFAEVIRVPASWLIPLPSPLTLRQSMILGTAGFTAALCVDRLIHNGVEPTQGEVLVTGATGGVGSLAIALLAKLGYTVTAVTGKAAQHGFLQSLGATTILHREDLNDASGKPLLKERWAGVVDTVGGNTLATALKTTRYGGCVTACGLVGGAELATTVYPFILRGVSLVGIDSAQCPMSLRRSLWQKLATNWQPAGLENLAKEVSLSQLSGAIDTLLRGESVGRILVNLKTD